MNEMTPSQKRRFDRRRDWYPRGSLFRIRGSRGFRRPEMLTFGVYVSGGGPEVQGLCSLVTNEGVSSCTDVRSLAPLDFVPDWEDFPMRSTLPYVINRNSRGVEFLLDRDFGVLCSRIDGRVMIGSEDETGQEVREGEGRGEMIYHDGCKPWRDESARARCRAVLAEWGVRPRPWTGLNGVSGVELAP